MMKIIQRYKFFSYLCSLLLNNMPLTFDPNAIGRPNGNYFALPYKLEEAEIVLLPVPWDATASYGTGTHRAPDAIIKASAQVDLYDADVHEAWKIKIGTAPLEKSILKLNKQTRHITEEVIDSLENGIPGNLLGRETTAVNKAGEKLNAYVYHEARNYLERGKIVAIVGGEHSVPFGLLKALDEKYKSFGILHIDAHADLREAYEGFTYSHASIMYNALKQLRHVDQLVSVAVRDYCADEAVLMAEDSRIKAFTDKDLYEAAFSGEKWAAQCRKIIDALPKKVYISFDVDGLSPENCPHTGTPVPGGLSYNKALFLLKMLATTSGKQIIGFDLCEVTPVKHDEWDANVGARLLYKLCCYTAKNNKII